MGGGAALGARAPRGAGVKLAALQAALAAAVTGRGDSAEVEALIRPARGIPPAARLDAHRATIRDAHLGALDTAYPVCREVLGPKYWRRLLGEEIQAFGDAGPDLNRYGEFLPELLARAQARRPELAELGYLGELAALEWRVHEAGFAADDPPFDWAAFRALDDAGRERLRLAPSRALRLLRFEHPVDELWRRHRDGPPGWPPQAPVRCCVHRAGRFEVSVARLDDGEAALLEALGAGRALGELPGAEGDAAGTLFRMIERGWIAAAAGSGT